MGISPCACGKKTPCDRKDDCTAFHIWRAMDGHMRDFAVGQTVAGMLR